MYKERDLLPWIFGGLSAAAIAVAFAAVSTHRAEATLAPPAAAARALVPQELPATATSQSAPQPGPPAALPATLTDSAPNPSPPPAQTAVEPQVQAGQIWECTTKGVKTFSNNPCGENSTLLDVGPINSMRALPAVHYARAYGPDQSAPTDADDNSDQYASDTGGNSYTIVGVVPRRRPEQIHRPPSAPAHHNPAPVRRY
jgi:hypothetical protein